MASVKWTPLTRRARAPHINYVKILHWHKVLENFAKRFSKIWKLFRWKFTSFLIKLSQFWRNMIKYLNFWKIRKNPFFQEKFRKIEHILQKVLKYLKNSSTISNFHLLCSHSTNPAKFPMNSIIYFRNFSKTSAKLA